MLETLIICGAGIVSGKEIMALELGEGLIQRGRSVQFIISSWNNGDFPNRLKQVRIPTHILPIGFISATLTKRCLEMTLEQLLRWPGLLRSYFGLLRRLKPQKIVHTNWHHLLLVFPLLRPERDFFWLHEVVPDLPQYRRVFGWLGGRVGAFICVSEASARSLRKIGIDDAQIRIIHNGLADPNDLALPRVPSPGGLRFGIVGQVNAWKGHEDLLEAFALLAQEHSTSEVHIFGDGNAAYKDGLVRKSRNLGIHAQVKWHDYTPDRRLIYSSFDVCVVPSRSEDPLPTTAIEASFFGLPIVATCRGGLPEIIEHEVSGLVVEAERPVELAEAFSRLIEEPSFRQRLGSNARRRAIEHFGRDRFLDEFIGLLKLEEPANCATVAACI